MKKFSVLKKLYALSQEPRASSQVFRKCIAKKCVTMPVLEMDFIFILLVALSKKTNFAIFWSQIM